jgi:uncharacterized protein YxjI
MKYHIKQRAWTLREEFIVRDQNGNPAFKIKGKFFHIGDNLIVHDVASHAEVAHIKQKMLHLTPHYEIHHNGTHWASLHEKLLHLFGEHFKIKLENGSIYHIEGNISNWDFTVTNDHGDLIAQIGQRVSLLHDFYGVDIAQDVDVPLVISLAITIEMIREHQSEKDKE